MRLRDWRTVFAVLCGVLVSAEVWLVFGRTRTLFAIEGLTPYRILSFSTGGTVEQAFLMRGEGLQAVAAHFDSRRPTVATVQWQVRRGVHGLELGDESIFVEGVSQVELRGGWQWISFPVVRDATSHDRWYRLTLKLLEPNVDVFVIGTVDNPDRGGALWVDKVLQTGSLRLRAERQGRTLYRRFQREAERHLPEPLRRPAVQWLLVVVLHASLIIVAYETLRPARPIG